LVFGLDQERDVCVHEVVASVLSEKLANLLRADVVEGSDIDAG
jgi:hypothetical protein